MYGHLREAFKNNKSKRHLRLDLTPTKEGRKSDLNPALGNPSVSFCICAEICCNC